MPLYEYECEACSQRFEVIQRFSEATEACRLCGKGPVRRLISSPAIQFKGTGWYITDYAQKGKAPSDNGPSDGKGESKSEGKSDGKGDTKSDGKSDTGSTTTGNSSSAATTPAPSTTSAKSE